MSDLSPLRKEYQTQGISEADLLTDPFGQFAQWFDEAVRHCPAHWFEPNAMTLATADRSGRVTSRTVLLKHFDERTFSFFTNYDSEKSHQIAENLRVSLLFHWPYQNRQIRIDGSAHKTTRQVSEKYFHARPRGAQIGATISKQSQIVASRGELDRLWKEASDRFGEGTVPLPENWGGFTVTPDRFEFWQGRVDRLHDCFRYLLRDQQWQLDRLYP